MRRDASDVASRGLGLGLLISNATIERFGGSVRQFARDGGGCVTEIELPLLRDAVGPSGR
jgi:two-component system sensor histidine kinase RegB